jgi:predicted glycosyltransferase
MATNIKKDSLSSGTMVAPDRRTEPRHKLAPSAEDMANRSGAMDILADVEKASELVDMPASKPQPGTETPPSQNNIKKEIGPVLGLGVERRIWIDMDNSPHVPFFIPIIEELRKRGHEVILTARDAYQVRELLELHHLSCMVLGRHFGKNRAAKILGTCLRATRLLPKIFGQQIDLAVSHGSRAQMMCGFALRIPTLLILDYEYIAMMGFIRPDWILVPQMIPDSKELQPKRQILRYPGLKEDVYVPRLQVDQSLRNQLGLEEADIVVTVRPPAVEAHYHNPESDVLLDATLKFLMQVPDVRVILLPRNEGQGKALRKTWEKWISNRKIVVPENAVDGMNLIWFSDLVISGGGTMNREAAALGVPVYSIFRGKIGAVDRQLQREGRLILIESVEDIQKKIVLTRRQKSEQVNCNGRPALQSIVDSIVKIAG